MPVNIKILGPKYSPNQVGFSEYKLAESIQDSFKKEFIGKKINGEILIMPNYKALNQKAKDIDLVLWVKLEGYEKRVSSRYRYIENGKEKISANKKSFSVKLANALVTIELKELPPDRVIFTDGIVKGKYDSGWKNISEQSENQKTSLMQFLRNFNIEKTPFISNLILFSNLKSGPGWGNTQAINVIYKEFNLDNFLNTLCKVNPPFKISDKVIISSSVHKDYSHSLTQEVEKTFNSFYKTFLPAKNQSLGTRAKLEKVIKRELDDKNKTLVNEVGNKTIFITGTPGSGKTIHLLHLGYHLAKDFDKRCLILTYNKALIADINRLNALAGFKNDIDGSTIETNTCVSLMSSILKSVIPDQINQDLNEFRKSYYDKYENLLNKLIKELEGFSSPELKGLLNDNLDLNYDTILIDESQDWFEQEKEILYKIFGSENFVISFGSQQMIRKQIPTNWKKGSINSSALHLKQTFRQKKNLCSFLDSVIESFDIDKSHKVNNKIIGGNVICKIGGFNAQEIKNILNSSENKAGYDNLILCNNDQKLINSLIENNVEIHNGTIDENKSKIPLSMDAVRLFNYESCRGLEGWIVIADKVDLFLERKAQQITESMEGLTLEETKERTIQTWLFMVFSRAIDTFCFSLDNPKSPISIKLLTLVENQPDYCTRRD